MERPELIESNPLDQCGIKCWKAQQLLGRHNEAKTSLDRQTNSKGKGGGLIKGGQDDENRNK